MACPDESALLDFASGHLTGAAAEALEAHLDGCPDCRALVVEASRDDTAVSPGGGTPGAAGASPFKLGRYLVLEMIDAGGMGVVYGAFDPELERKVALKVLHPTAQGAETATQAQGRLLREAQAMAKLSHPNVAAVYDVGMVGEQVFLAMELVDGGNLVDWMGGGPRPWREVVATFLDAGAGLAAAHAAGLVHRDFKPANVLRGRDGRVRVTDFGLARPVVLDPPADAGDPALSASGTGGTPAYMAPEQFAGGSVDARSDQFSFCVALWEALYGERPFGGKNFADHRAEVLAGRVRAPSAPGRVPAWLHAVLLRGLSVAPESRFPFMENLLSALGRSQRGARWARWGAGAGAALALAAAVAALQVGRPRGDCVAPGDDGLGGGLGAALPALGEPFDSAVRRDARALAAVERRVCLLPGEDSSDARQRCAAERRRDLLALVRAAADAQPGVAAEALARLAPPEACLGARDAARRWPPPTPALDAAAQAVADAEALRLVGKAEPAVRAAERAEGLARAAESQRLEARALLTRALARLDVAPAEPGDKLLHEAAAAAERAQDPAFAARAWTAILGELALRGTSAMWAEAAAAHARAYLAVAGGDEALEARIETALARALPGARAHADRAVALAERTPSVLARSDARRVRGELAAKEGRQDEARADLLQAAQDLEAALGLAHPRTTAGLVALARGLREARATSDAKALLERAKASLEMRGAGGLEMAGVLVASAEVALDAGDVPAAERMSREALAIVEKLRPGEAVELASEASSVHGRARWAAGDETGGRAEVEGTLATLPEAARAGAEAWLAEHPAPQTP